MENQRAVEGGPESFLSVFTAHCSLERRLPAASPTRLQILLSGRLPRCARYIVEEESHKYAKFFSAVLCISLSYEKMEGQKPNHLLAPILPASQRPGECDNQYSVFKEAEVANATIVNTGQIQ